MNFTAKGVLKPESSFQKLENRSAVQVILEAGIASVILVLAALGNFLMMLVMYKKKQLRTVPNFFVLNLSVGNFLLAVTVLPVFIWTLTKGQWTFSETFCEIYGYQNYLLFAVTLFTLTAISLNRYILICYPSKYQGIFDKQLVLKIIIAIWICCVVSCSPPLFGWGHYGFNPRTALCHTDTTSTSFKISANTFMLMDIIIVLFCNVRIVRAVKAHRRRVAVNQKVFKANQPDEETQGITAKDVDANKTAPRTEAYNPFTLPKQHELQSCASGKQSEVISAKFIYVSQKRQDSSALEVQREGSAVNKLEVDKKRHCATVCFRTNGQSGHREHKPAQIRELCGDDIHITRTISLIVLVFCCCWLPCFIMDSMDASGVFPPRNVRMAGIYLIFLDSVLAPFIYGIRNRKLRKAFIDVLKCDY